jgi:uncharacterized coiled-coil protein SlyX
MEPAHLRLLQLAIKHNTTLLEQTAAKEELVSSIAAMRKEVDVQRQRLRVLEDKLAKLHCNHANLDTDSTLASRNNCIRDLGHCGHDGELVATCLNCMFGEQAAPTQEQVWFLHRNYMRSLFHCVQGVH